MGALIEEFIGALKRQTAEWRKELEPLEAGGMRIGEKPFGGSWSDVTDREIASLKTDISSHERTIARLEKDLGST